MCGLYSMVSESSHVQCSNAEHLRVMSFAAKLFLFGITVSVSTLENRKQNLRHGKWFSQSRSVAVLASV